MKIYLDIDGTLLHKTTFKPANHLKPFLDYVISYHDVYWLTTHCNGDITSPVNYLMQYAPNLDRSFIERIKPTGGYTFKTEVLDLSTSSEFLWFDDQPLQGEIKLLEKTNHSKNWIKINLDENPDILARFILLT